MWSIGFKKGTQRKQRKKENSPTLAPGNYGWREIPVKSKQTCSLLTTLTFPLLLTWTGSHKCHMKQASNQVTFTVWFWKHWRIIVFSGDLLMIKKEVRVPLFGRSASLPAFRPFVMGFCLLLTVGTRFFSASWFRAWWCGWLWSLCLLRGMTGADNWHNHSQAFVLFC